MCTVKQHAPVVNKCSLYGAKAKPGLWG